MGDNDQDNDGGNSNRQLTKKPRTDEEDEKRKNFLERNRLGKIKRNEKK